MTVAKPKSVPLTEIVPSKEARVSSSIILLILIWESKITKLITLISFISAALAFALRDFVYNFLTFLN